MSFSLTSALSPAGRPGPRRAHGLLSVLSAVVVCASCSTESAPLVPETVPLLELSAEPTLEIGVVEGAPEYAFQHIASVVRLTSGSVVVSDRGTGEISVFDATGTFVRAWGGEGEGPGEFQGLATVYRLGSDSLMVLDGWTRRISLFDTTGAFGRQMDAATMSRDTVFPMDVWLHGRFWVEGALDGEARARVRLALERLPPPVASPGYRRVRVADGERLWILEPEVRQDGTRRWTVVDPEGQARGVIDVPGSFEPMEIRDDRVTGRWIGQDDVHFVRGYALRTLASREAVPDWMLPAAPDEPTVPPDEAEFMERIRSSLREMARAQEIHYSRAMTYTSSLDELEWERPADIEVDVVAADTRGWAGVFTHQGLDRICGLGYGAAVPPGWAMGGVVCGQPISHRPDNRS